MNNYQLIKSKRKTLGISIKPDGIVVIRAPLKAPEKIISQFVAKYQSWIDKKLAKINQRLQAKTTDNKSFYFLGKEYPIKACSIESYIGFNGTNILLNTALLDRIPQILPEWYKIKTLELVEPVLQAYAQKFNLKYTKLKITKAKTRWGSCSSNGTICFSYKIAMLPINVINYIVVHELAHLKHFNHGVGFWQQVELMYPEYKDATTWLKANQHNIQCL